MMLGWLRSTFGLLALLSFAGTAWAADDEWTLPDEEDEDEDDDAGSGSGSGATPPPPVEGDVDVKKTLEDTDAPDDDEIPMGDDTQPALDFDDEDEEDTSEAQQPGEDTASIYRAKIDEMKGWAADEEAMEWEQYLKRYPNSLFRSRIEARMDELGEKMFDQHLTASTTGSTDAGERELFFATPLQLENLDPRSKLRFGFEWGFPQHFSLLADYEQQILRELSVHGGIRGRYAGTNFEAGVRYALVKSVRTQWLVTGVADFRYNFDPAYPAFRPQIGVGKRANVADGLDLQLEGGTDLAFASSGVSPRLVGGFNVTLHANRQVSVFIEGSSYMKDMFDDTLDGGGFRFNVVSFGMQFVGVKGNRDTGKGVGLAKLAATAPVMTNYWGYHSGAVDADFNYYL
jgi:hypothetical protein